MTWTQVLQGIRRMRFEKPTFGSARYASSVGWQARGG